jgi:hypothetical protein
LTKKHWNWKIFLQDEADFQHDMELISEEKSGLKWHENPTQELLKEDVENGRAT